MTLSLYNIPMDVQMKKNTTLPTTPVSDLREKAEFAYGFHAPRTEKLTPQQEKKYAQDIKKTLELVAKGKIKPAHSVKELRQQIEEEEEEEEEEEKS